MFRTRFCTRAGDLKSIRAALARLADVIRDHAHSEVVEEAIYLTAIGQSALPVSQRNASTRAGTLEFLEYLADGYVPAQEGAPTALLESQWDVGRDGKGKRRSRSKSLVRGSTKGMLLEKDVELAIEVSSGFMHGMAIRTRNKFITRGLCSGFQLFGIPGSAGVIIKVERNLEEKTMNDALTPKHRAEAG